MKTRVFYIFGFVVFATILAMTSCRDQDFDFEEAYRANPIVEFEHNFETIFGKIAPDQSWDFSGYTYKPEAQIEETRAGNPGEGTDLPDFVDRTAGLNFNLNSTEEPTTNVGLTNSLFDDGTRTVASLKSTGDSFTIYPIATKSTQKYTLFVKIGDNEPISVFSKDWDDGLFFYYNRKATETKSGVYASLEDNYVHVIKNNQVLKKSQYLTNSGISTNDDHKFAKVKDDNGHRYFVSLDNYEFLTVNNSPSLTTTSIFSEADYYELKHTDGWIWPASGDNLFMGGYRLYSEYFKDNSLLFSSSIGRWTNSFWSIETENTWGKKKELTSEQKSRINSLLYSDETIVVSRADMKGITIDAPKGVDIKVYVQLEDGQKIGLTGNSSNNPGAVRFNSTVRPEEVASDKTIDYLGIDLDGNTSKDYYNLVLAVVHEPSTISKRYMVEDLGSVESSDIDFNDVVFDLTKTETIFGSESTAIIRAMGGTLDFDLKVGTKTIFTKSSSNYNVSTMYNTERLRTNYNLEMKKISLDANLWDPEANNVSVVVKSNTSSGVYELTFPENGDVPRIIAFTTSKQWRDERHQICNDWMFGNEPADWEWPEPHDQEGDMTYEKWLKEYGNQTESN